MSNESSRIDSPGTGPSEPSQDVRSVLVPSLILIGSQIPLTVIYGLNLAGSREHYKLFPAALLTVVFLLVLRWPKGEERPFFPSVLSMVLLACGVVLAILGTLFLSPWFGYASLVAFTGSLFARTNDRARFGSLISLLVPLLVLVQPPTGIDFDNVQGDIQLMSTINSWSTSIASDILDALGFPLLKMDYVNLVAGSRIEVPGGSVDTIDIGTRGSSVFSLLIATAIYISVMRRPLFRSLALLAVCIFWATVGEAIHAVICVAGASSFEMNWLENAEPGWLRLGILLFSFSMTLLSDHFIAFLFGKVEMATIDEDMKGQFWLCQTWNFVVAGVESPVIDINVRHEVAWAKWRNSALSHRTTRKLWVAAIGCTVLAVFQVMGIGRASSLAGRHALQQGNGDWLEMSGDLLPPSLAGAEMLKHHITKPAQKTAFRAYENSWTFCDASRPEVQYEISVSQAWPGWHDAIANHMRNEWILNDSQPANGTVVDLALLPGVPVVFADFHNTIAENGMLAFCHFDSLGEPFERPLAWSDLSDFWRRATQRTRNRIRPRIFVPDSILIEVKVHTVDDLPESIRQRALEIFSAATQVLRQKIIEQQLPVGGEPSADAPANETDRPLEEAGRIFTDVHLAQLFKK